MKLGLALARATIGGLLIGHGTQKLFGWFGGEGLDPTAAQFEQLGLRPGKRNAILSGASEGGAGVLMVLGLCMPAATAALTGSMATAISKVHGPRGPWNPQGGYEYNVALVLFAMAFTDAGPGPLSLDALHGHEEWGIAWALAGVATGVAASQLAIELGKRGGSPGGAAGPLPGQGAETTPDADTTAG